LTCGRLLGESTADRLADPAPALVEELPLVLGQDGLARPHLLGLEPGDLLLEGKDLRLPFGPDLVNAKSPMDVMA
jgi:hypothetical protein